MSHYYDHQPEPKSRFPWNTLGWGLATVGLAAVGAIGVNAEMVAMSSELAVDTNEPTPFEIDMRAINTAAAILDGPKF